MKLDKLVVHLHKYKEYREKKKYKYRNNMIQKNKIKYIMN